MNKNKNNQQIIAVAVIKPTKKSKINGTIHFYERVNIDKNKRNIVVNVNLSGFKKYATHAIHVHEAGDLTDDCCMDTCSHLNPYKKNHGGIHSKERHVGDLGNIVSDKDGNVKCEFSDHMIKLRGFKSNIIGRAIVIHADCDDNGLGGATDSLTTGHAGKRIACAVIGYSKEMFIKK